MNKEFTMELEFKEPLTPDENVFFQKQLDFWGIKKQKDGIYHIFWDNDFPLYSAMIKCKNHMKSIIYKLSKCIIHGIFDEDEDLINGWKEDGEI